MAQLPINVPQFTNDELAKVREYATSIKKILIGKFINLEPDDRQRYGSINEKNKLVVNKVKEYQQNMPELANPKVDWKAYEQHYTTRANFMAVTAIADELNELCNDPRTLVDYVLYGLARADYKFTKYSAEEDGGGASGFEAKYNDLKQFFNHESDDEQQDGSTPAAPTTK